MNSLSVVSSILILLTLSAANAALAYDGSWHKEANWSGEYPNGFTMNADVTVDIRPALDLNAPKSLACLLKRGSTYHEWNKKRVASDQLKFLSFTKIATYEVNSAFNAKVEVRHSRRTAVIKFKQGDRWAFLAYLGEGSYVMSVAGKEYIGDQDLISNSTEVGPHTDDKEGYDEWLGLKCANGAVGWILFREIQEVAGFGQANITEYGKAEDESSPSSERSYWEHNGSVVYLVAEGNTRQFLYSEPRVGMLEAGARPDDLLFSGTVSADDYTGTAYIFDARCGRYPYHVSGRVLERGGLVVMHGLAPRVDHACRVRSKLRDTLRFRYLGNSAFSSGLR